MQQRYKLYLKNIRQLIQISDSKQPFKRMQQCSDICLKNNFSIVVDQNGRIHQIGPHKQISQKYKEQQFDQIINCQKFTVMPGFVDAHTHALFAGDRSKQYEMKINQMKYVDIYNAGLGIRHTYQAINKASLSELEENLDRFLPKISKLGTTSLEIKSGYGLNADAEVKMLKAIQSAKKKYQDKLTIVSTFCGAHAIPKGKTQQQQTKDVIQSQIPAVKQAIDNKQISPAFIDVFCEKNFFETESSIKIMEAGKKIGLVPNFHGDQLNNLESGTIATKVGARGVSHCQHLSQESIRLMSQNKIAVILLPTTQNIQKLPLPPIPSIRSHNSIVALGSDFCPNAFCYNMGLTSHYACTNYRLFPKETIVAATLNSAYALNLHEEVGSIEIGKRADFLVLDVVSWVYVVYGFGDNYIEKVIKNGKIL